MLLHRKVTSDNRDVLGISKERVLGKDMISEETETANLHWIVT